MGKSNLEKLQELLRTIFQFDCADLDFGIYRILNYKRERIEEFLMKELPKTVRSELEKGALAEQSQATKELQALQEQIRESMGDEALDAKGDLADAYHNTRLGKKYLQTKAKATGAKSHAALEAAIFSHLYSFFSRYYSDGDFMSKRRYSKREKYAIPYNGEEVYLHWANSDQYYIKTEEYFRDYTFTSQGITVHLKLQNAQVQQDNVKGDKRYFVPLTKQASYDAKKKEIVIPFEFRPLTEQEDISYGKKNQQDKIIAEAIESIPRQLGTNGMAKAALLAERRKRSDGSPVSFLEYHLRQYASRNTSDFFIHKDLKGFLERELEFYLKNEVLNLGDMEASGEERAEGWFQMMRVIRAIGGKIITFLAQIEDFQKKLFEKKKFITETHYCITVSNIAEEFYEEIAENEAQWDEWKDLFHIDEDERNLFTAAAKTKKQQRVAFLKNHPTLVLDTKHFSEDFKDRLLASFDDLDNMIDGLLIYGENFQAINLLLPKYRNTIKCIHIDPPYNTQTSAFLYKNDYQHSSWLTMMENRIAASLALLVSEGSYLCHIDENEYERLHLLFERFPILNAGSMVWDKRNPMTAGRGVATQHEYIIWRSRTDKPINLRSKNISLMLNKADELIKAHGGVTKQAKKEYADWVRNHPELSGGEKSYCYLDDEGRIYQSVSLRAPEPRTDPKFFKPLIHPITGKPCAIPPNGFSRTPETLQTMIKRGEIIFGPDETTQPRQKRFLSEESKRQISSVIQDAKRGKADLDALGLENFPYCHSVSFYMELIGAASNDLADIILDHFAGSGTTAHAVINLNREDGGRRRFILVEMGGYFDTVLLPRIKKVTFAPEWKDGKSKRMTTQEEAEHSPRIVKYIRLESYEDALNNISFTLPKGQQVLKFDDYLLKYMLEWETAKSDTFLNVEKLTSPFGYKLMLTENQETREKPVDLPETFNYLLGLSVKTKRVYDDKDRRYLVYRGTVDHKDIVVIWRDTKGWGKKELERDKKFVKEQKMTEGADEIFVNGDSFIPKARSLDPIFKHRMFAKV
jgi:adenine-specific DNA-methyltransferase